MREFVQKNPAAVIAVAVVAVLLAGWQLWANFFSRPSSNLPPNSPAARGMMPGPMGGVNPRAPGAQTPALPGSSAQAGQVEPPR
ncbi:MAG TPA: hypothetical protein VFB21_17880 [Chthonomonadaceae bacterium]|nr:hypothetical protein [Chthonomonadaceae bacterium]